MFNVISSIFNPFLLCSCVYLNNFYLAEWKSQLTSSNLLRSPVNLLGSIGNKKLKRFPRICCPHLSPCPVLSAPCSWLVPVCQKEGIALASCPGRTSLRPLGKTKSCFWAEAQVPRICDEPGCSPRCTHLCR